MKMSKRFNVTSKIVAGMIAGIVIVSGMTVGSLETEAADLTVKYTQCSVTDGNAEIPIEKDYVFGGWYETAGSEKPLKESVEQVVAERNDITTVYAKMVPAQVLSVKMQVNGSAKEDDGEKSTMRVLSAVDDTRYREVGFEVYLGDNTSEFPTEKISTVYKKLTYTTKGNNTAEMTAASLFGNAAEYMSAIQLTGIDDAHDSSKIYVRPYWVTLDGTKVQGLARYLHVVDEFKDYISVPVNVLSGEAIAAGQFVFSYDNSRFEVVTESGVEAGKIFGTDFMNYQVNDVKGEIKIVGITSDVTRDVRTDDLLANIRFKEKRFGSDSEEVVLTLKEQKCGNWAEEQKNIAVWDYRY